MFAKSHIEQTNQKKKLPFGSRVILASRIFSVAHDFFINAFSINVGKWRRQQLPRRTNLNFDACSVLGEWVWVPLQLTSAYVWLINFIFFYYILSASFHFSSAERKRRPMVCRYTMSTHAHAWTGWTHILTFSQHTHAYIYSPLGGHP